MKEVGGDSPLCARICHRLTKEKLIIFIVAGKILMLVLRAASCNLSRRLVLCYARTNHVFHRMSYYRQGTSGGAYGVRGRPGANYCSAAAPGTHLIRCFEAAVPGRRCLSRGSQGRTD